MRTYTGFTLDYVLYDLSYTNLMMLSAVIPSYSSDKKKDKSTEEKISGDDPKNKDRINRELELLG